MRHCYTTEWYDGSLIVWNDGGPSGSIRVYEDGDLAEDHAKLASLLQKRNPFIIKRHSNLVEAKSYIRSQISPDKYDWIHYYTLPLGYRDKHGEKAH